MNQKIDGYITFILEDYSKKLNRNLSSSEIEEERRWRLFCFKRYLKMINIISKVIDKEDIEFLDIGAVFGHFPYLLKKFFKSNVSGLDISSPLHQKIKEILKTEGIILKPCDLNNLNKKFIPFKNNSFDFVIFAEVLEHLLISPLHILKEINRVLKKGGYLLLTTPNFSCLINRVKVLFGKNVLAMYKEQESPYWRHWRLYIMDECISVLKQSNFDIIQHSYFDFVELKFRPKIISFTYRLITNLFRSFRDTLIILAKK